MAHRNLKFLKDKYLIKDIQLNNDNESLKELHRRYKNMYFKQAHKFKNFFNINNINLDGIVHPLTLSELVMRSISSSLFKEQIFTLYIKKFYSVKNSFEYDGLKYLKKCQYFVIRSIENWIENRRSSTVQFHVLTLIMMG